MKGSSFGYLLKTGFKNVYMNRLMSFASIGVLVACLMLIGSAILFSLNVRAIVGAIEDQNEMVAYLPVGTTDREAKVVGNKIESFANIASCTYVSPQEAWELEKQKWGDASDFVETSVDGEELGDILPPTFRIKLVEMSPDSLEKTRKQLITDAGIKEEDIKTPQQEATILTNLESAISTVGAVIVIILALVSVVIIANTIKITIFSRRKEINIMKLVGATNTFIKLPFVIEGMLIGLISALLAFGFLWVAYDYAMQYMTQNPTTWLEIAANNLIDFKDISYYMMAGFAIAGSGLGIIGSSLFIRKHLKV